MTKLFSVARSYDRKNSDGGKDRIGLAEFTIESKAEMVVKLNGQELPAASIDHLLTFALQSLQDAYAGAESESDARERFEAKLERIINGTLGTRTGGSGVDPITVEIRNLIRADIKKAIGDDWKTMDDDARNEALDKVFGDQPDDVKAALTDAAKGEIARKAAEKAAKAALGSKLTINLGK
jgi:hypothetical protein